jgi:hypothetical protein
MIAFLVIQLTIPMVRLTQEHDRSQRLGWQMFSFVTAVEFTVVTETGEAKVDYDAVLARPRGDLALEDLIPPHVCATFDGAVRVVWDGGSYEC